MKDTLKATLNRLCLFPSSDAHTAFLVLDKNGTIHLLGGALNELSLSACREGTKAADHFPFLRGVLPLKGDLLEFSDIREPDAPIMDALLFKAEDGYGLILSAAKNKERFGPRHLYQDRLLEGVFQALDIAVLEMDRDGSFVLIGTPPGWVEQIIDPSALTSQFPQKNDVMDFLGHFTQNATDRWRKSLTASIRSGPWTVASEDGRQTVYEAVAAQIQTRKLLIISRIMYPENSPLPSGQV